MAMFVASLGFSSSKRQLLSIRLRLILFVAPISQILDWRLIAARGVLGILHDGQQPSSEALHQDYALQYQRLRAREARR